MAMDPCSWGWLPVSCPPLLKLPECMMDQQLFTKVLDALHDSHGKRFNNMKAMTQFDIRTGRLNWKQGGAYSLEIKDDRVDSITHKISGAKVVVPGHVVWTREAILGANWSHLEASVHMQPTPALKIASLFENTKTVRVGPWQATHYTNKGLLFAQLCEQLRQEHERLAAQDPEVIDVQTACKNEFAKPDKERSKVSMSKARESAMEAMAKEKAKKVEPLA